MVTRSSIDRTTVANLEIQITITEPRHSKTYLGVSVQVVPNPIRPPI